MTWTPIDCVTVGACCVDGDCLNLDEATCQQADGVYAGNGTTCGEVDCDASAPCCFEATGGCVDLDPVSCAFAGGVVGTTGDTCAQTTCFPIGACCLPDGACVDGVSPDACSVEDGVFQGDGTTCGSTDCPEPVGAACFPNGFCLSLTEAEAAAAGADWKGPGTDCSDGNGDGVSDACGEVIPGDFNGDGLVNGIDLGIFLVGWGQPGTTDLDGNDTTDGVDLGIMLVSWTG